LKYNICYKSITAMSTTRCCFLMMQKSGFYSHTYCCRLHWWKTCGGTSRLYNCSSLIEHLSV